MIKPPRIQIEIIESMRGVAALGVACYHFGNGTMQSIVPNSFGSFFEWARLGIPMFFIISAFVIPYSMYTSGYTINDAGRYFLKRMVRMAPPAWVSIGIIFMIYFAAVMINGKPIEDMTWPGFSPKAILANFLFSFNVFHVEKYIEVYWTLEVEFQFYILITMLLPLILRFAGNQVALSIILIALNLTFLFHNERILFFKYNTYFILGILLFLYRMNLIKRNYFIYACILAITACYIQVGMIQAYACVMAVLLIGLVKFQHPVTNFLGMISFSLYITHHNTGVVAEFLLRDLYGPDPSGGVQFLMFIIYLGLAIGFAWVFYMLIEKPFMNLSKKISMKPATIKTGKNN